MQRKQIMRKGYVMPETNVVYVRVSSTLLAGSFDGNAGSADDDEPLTSKEAYDIENPSDGLSGEKVWED